MKVAIIGLGYIGLPLTFLLSSKKYDVIAIDKDMDKIKKLRKGVLPFARNEPLFKEYFARSLQNKNVVYTKYFESIKETDIILVSVDTPIIGKKPNYKALDSAISQLAVNIKKKSIVVIESTLAPNTTKNFVIPTIEKLSRLKVNTDFYVAVVPERIRPGYIYKQLTSFPRVIGISSPKIKSVMRKIYKDITNGELDFVDLTTAETVKTVENTFRDVNIAFANEVAIACEEQGVNVWEVRKLINKSPFHNMLEPGAGVGGHCIPKDPWLLASSVIKQSLKITRTARAINDSMPKHVLELAEKSLAIIGRKIKNTNLVILGYSYIGNSDDSRNSPTKDLVKRLKMKKAIFKIHDPYVSPYDQTNLERVITGADCLILMVAHDYYKKLKLKDIASKMNIKIIVDGRNFFDKKQAQKNGFIYKGVGNV